MQTNRESLLQKRVRWESLKGQARGAEVRIAVLASFTANPLEPYLGVALSDRGVDARVHIGPYNQIVPQCVDPAGELHRDPPDVLIVWPDLATLWSGRELPLDAAPSAYAADLEETATAALAACDRWSATLLYVLPAVPSVRPCGLGDAQSTRGIHATASFARERARSILASHPRALVLDFEEVVRELGLEDALDPRLEHIARIPYSERAFDRLGRAAARVLALRRNGTKRLLLVEPDGTLWDGAASPTGAADLRSPDDRLAFQAFLLELKRTGLELGVWSAREEDALAAAFARREMRLRRGDFARWQVGSPPDPEAIAAFAGSLGLAPDQVVLLLPPGRGAPERQHPAPGPLLIGLPDAPEGWIGLVQERADLDQWPPLLADSSAAPPSPGEARAVDLDQFMTRLGVQVEVAAVRPEDVARVAHITETTKDFNSTGRVYSEVELAVARTAPGVQVLAVHVSDRFGDYGVAGAALTADAGETLEVTALWLNCRVLGKRVEVKVLEALAALARGRGHAALRFHYVPTDRNHVAEEWLRTLGMGGAPGRESALAIGVEEVAQRVASAAGAAVTTCSVDDGGKAPAPAPASAPDRFSVVDFASRRWKRQARAAHEEAVRRLSQPAAAEAIVADIRHSRQKQRKELDVPFVAPRTETETRVAKIFADRLRVERVGVFDNFFLCGGHSILATQLVFDLHQAFDIELPVRVLFENPTVATVAQTLEALERHGKVDTGYDGVTATYHYVASVSLPKEVALDPAIDGHRAAPPAPAPPRRIFVTGATGFLGAFLVDELIRTTDAELHCLVRAKDAEQARARLERNLRGYGLGVPPPARVHVVPGDLAQPCFGLATAEFTRLAQAVDAILHAGAATQFLDPYPKVKPTNVLGTQEIVRLAATERLKPVHFASTLYVFSPLTHPEGDVVSEDQMPAANEILTMGYTQSKWVAEHLLDEAKRRGVPCTLYRCGRISGHSATGACQTNDFMWRMIKASVETGLVFDHEMAIDMVPVDYVARSMVHLMRRDESRGKVFHLQGARLLTMEQVREWMKAFGYRIAALPYADFRRRVVEFAQASQESSVAAMLAFLPVQIGDTRMHVQCSTERTRAALAGSGIACPPVDEAAFERYLRYFVATGFLPAPAAAATAAARDVPAATASASEGRRQRAARTNGA